MPKCSVIPLIRVTSPTRAKALNGAERAWAEELNRVLQACPTSRIGAATMGDATLVLYDRSLEREPGIRKIVENASDFIPGLDKAGIRLATIHASFNIDSTAA